VVLDVDISHEDRMELYRRFRAVSVDPILIFLPAYHETQILEAYAAGTDAVVIKPVSPAIFPTISLHSPHAEHQLMFDASPIGGLFFSSEIPGRSL
jgi:CheY-like chemotaxis protein